MVTKKEAKALIKKHYKEYSQRAKQYGQPLQKKYCSHLTKDFICNITSNDKKEGTEFEVERSLSYCAFMHHLCNLANGRIKLQPNEYMDGKKIIAGKIFVNNKGIRFNCFSHNRIECPFCSDVLLIINFTFGIYCDKCNKQIH